jgi:hypothetical protein
VSLIPFIDIDFILLHLSMRLSTALELKGINDTLLLKAVRTESF